MTEKWVPIAEFLGYEVSSLGRVRSPRQVLKTPKLKSGYLSVCIHKQNRLVHREVAKAFLGDPPFADAETNHKDGNKGNPTLANLEWVTKSENARHSYRVLGHVPHSKGKFSGAHNTSIPVIATCMKTGNETRYEAGMDAVRAGFRSDGISRACAGKAAHHAGFLWRYAKDSA